MNGLIIALRSRVEIDSFLPHFVWGIWGVAGLIFLFFGVSMSLFHFEKTQESIQTVAPVVRLDMAKMLTGPLALKHNPRSPLAIALEKKLLFLAQSLRPDLKKEEARFCVGIQGVEGHRILQEGEKVFLTLEENGVGGIVQLGFSQEPTPCALKVQGGSGSSLIAYVEKGSQKLELVLNQTGAGVPKQYPGSVWKLKQAKCWGSDAFFLEYGGAEYKKLGQKKRLELDEGKQRQVLLLSLHDYLTMKEEKWEVVPSLQLASRQAPLAQVVAMTPQYVEIEAWDAEGFPLFKVKVAQEPKKKMNIDAKKLIDSPRLRSLNQFSCNVEKKRLVLKAGDWLVKTKTGWHKLKTVSEIEATLRQEFGQELLVIDEIDAQGVIRGKLFDEMRTHFEPIVVSIAPDKKEKSAKKKEKTS